MTRIVVEEDGSRRAFRLAEGRVAIGSGAAAKIRLAAEGVADVHADLELAGGRVTLAPRPGVLPPKVNGKPIAGPVVLERGARIEIGAARLVLEPEILQEEASAPAAGAAARGPARASPRAARARKASGGLPSWMIGGGILLAVVLALLLGRGLWSKGASSASPVHPLAKARESLAEGHLRNAERELERIDPARLSGEARASYEELSLEIARTRERIKARWELEEANSYLETQLKRYESQYLKERPDNARIRLFLERARTFESTWPTHPELDWVRRQVGRFRGTVDLAVPPTFDELAWKVRVLTSASPRDYGEVFAALDAFAARAGAEDRAKLDLLRAEHEAARAAYFEDRRQQVIWHWDRGEKGRAVEWLVQLVTKIGERDMANEAAVKLVELPGIEGWLRTYAEEKPGKFALLSRNSTVAAYCRAHGIP